MVVVVDGGGGGSGGAGLECYHPPSAVHVLPNVISVIFVVIVISYSVGNIHDILSDCIAV